MIFVGVIDKTIGNRIGALNQDSKNVHLIVVNTSLEGEQRRFKDEKTSTENAKAIGIQNRKDAKPKQKGC